MTETDNGPREYRAAQWNEPVIMEMGHPGRRGLVFPDTEPKSAKPSVRPRI